MLSQPNSNASTHNQFKKSLSTPQAESSQNHKQIYDNYVSSYGTHFRANKDYQYEEKPRQIITTILFFCILLFISYITSIIFNKSKYNDISISNDYDSQSFSITIKSISNLINNTISSQNSNNILKNENINELFNININHPLLITIKYSLLGILITIIFYCFLQSRDSLFVRPHPGVWRVVHAFGLVQFLILIFIYILPPDFGRNILQLFFPNFSDSKSVFSGVIEIDCSINKHTILRQLQTPWVPCHLIGWFLKMCMFRHWGFCIFYSIIFEAVELSFQWLIPEMKECWWDSIILDILLFNMLGMIAGAWFLNYLGSRKFDWVKPTFGSRVSKYNSLPSNSILSFFSKYFLPFTFSDYNWRFFKSSKRLAHSLFLLFVALTLEINSFFLMYVLDLKATHHLNIARTINVCLLALLTVAEHYEYIEGKSQRIGHNELLLGSIYILEILIIIKYGPSRFDRFAPPWEIIQPWIISIFLLTIWSYFHFQDLATLKRQNKDSTDCSNCTPFLDKIGKKFLKFPVLLTFSPLLVLTRFYNF